MIRQFIETTLHPERYHGYGKSGPFFEGWYYKLVDAAERNSLAVIPGIFLGEDSSADHAFVQVLDGMTGSATYHQYDVQDFHAAKDRFEIQVGPCTFSDTALSLHIDDGTLRASGDVHFDGVTAWPVTLRSPGIMGWYGWVPVMECYHGVVSLDHTLRGVLAINDSRIDFTGGRGYIEKDWGQSFPSAYVWLQTNHFAQPGTSLTASIAIIPWWRTSFTGFIIGLWHDQQLYRFATYTGAEVEHLTVDDSHVHWVVRDRKHRLTIRAERAVSGLLKAPYRTEMHKRVDETMQAVVDVSLVTLAGHTVFEGSGRNAGLEVQGSVEMLFTR